MIKASTTRQPVTARFNPKEYHSKRKQRGDLDFTMSNSELSAFSENAWKWRNGSREEKTSAMDWGSILDCLILTPEMFDSRYAITPEVYPTEKDGDKPWNWNAKYCKEWRAEREKDGIECVKPNDASEAQLAKSRLLSDPIIAEILNDAQTQVMLCYEWHDDDTGLIIPMASLLDIVPTFEGKFRDYLFDLKTSADASERAWVSSVWSLRYYMQAALYFDAWNACNPMEEREHFGHIIQENEAPYAIARRVLTDEFVECGRDLYRSILRHYCQCLSQDFWPSYDDEQGNGSVIINGFRTVQPPIWEQKI